MIDGIVGREGPNWRPWRSRQKRLVPDGKSRHTDRRGRRDMFQMGGADAAMTPELVVVTRIRAPCRWWWFGAAGPSAR